MKIQARSAAVASPNTPESDRRKYVLHKVNATYGQREEVVLVYATDPMDAISNVNKMGEDEYISLVRA